jgi:spore coat protein U-like protein
VTNKTIIAAEDIIMKSKFILAAGVFTAATMLGVSPAMAGVTSGTLDVTASVAAACTIGNGTLSFGAYNGITQAAVDGQAAVSVTCTNTTAYNIYSQTAAVNRKMSDGDNTLTYKLYTDGSRGTELGTDALTATISGEGDGTAHDVNVFGTIDAGQAAIPGSYEQASVDLTISY